MADLNSRIGPKAKKVYRNMAWVRPGLQVNSQRRIQSSEHNQWHSRDNDSDTSASAISEEDRGMLSNSHQDNDNPSQVPTLLARMSESKSLIERVGPAITEDSHLYSSRSKTFRSRSISVPMDGQNDDTSQRPKPTITSEFIEGDSTMKMVPEVQTNGIASGHEAVRNPVIGFGSVQTHNTAFDYHPNHDGSHPPTRDAPGPGDSNTVAFSGLADQPPNSLNVPSLSHSQSQNSGREEGELSERSKSTPSSKEVRNLLLPLVLLNAEERLKQVELEGTLQGSIVELNPDAITKEDSASFYKNMERVGKDLKDVQLRPEAAPPVSLINATLQVSHAPGSTAGPPTPPQSSTMAAGLSKSGLPTEDLRNASQRGAYLDPGRRMMIEQEHARSIERKSPSRNMIRGEDFHPSPSAHPSTSPTRSAGYKREHYRGTSPSSQISGLSKSRHRKRPRSISPATPMAPDSASYHRHRRGSHATTSSSSRRSPEPRSQAQEPPYHHNRRASYATTSSQGRFSPERHSRHPQEKSSYYRNRPEQTSPSKFSRGREYERRDFGPPRPRSRSPVDRRGAGKHRDYDYPPRNYHHNTYQRRSPHRYRERPTNRSDSSDRPGRRPGYDATSMRRSASPPRRAQRPSDSGAPFSSSLDRPGKSSHVPSLERPLPYKPPEGLPRHDISDDKTSQSLNREMDANVAYEYASRSMSLETSISKDQVIEDNSRANPQSVIEPMQVEVFTPSPPSLPEEEENVVESPEVMDQDQFIDQEGSAEQDVHMEQERSVEQELLDQEEFVVQEGLLDQEEFIEQEEPEEEEEQHILPCHLVPGFWFFKIGLSDLGTLKCTFEIDHETAVKWNIPPPPPSELNQPPTPISDIDITHDLKPKISLQICSLSQQLIQEVMQELGPDPFPEQLTHAIYSTDKRWPPVGELIIEVNPGTEKQKTLLPQKLKPTSPPVMIENHVYEGMNEIQFIQLSGTPDTMFALYANEKPTISHSQPAVSIIPSLAKPKGSIYIEPAIVTVRPL